MRIVATAAEIDAAGSWEEFCQMKGINLYARAEGLMESSEEFEFTEDEARELRLLKAGGERW